MTRPERQCHATARSTGQRCGRAAIPGGTVCAFHGGKAPQTRQAAQRRLDEQALERRARAAVAAHKPLTVGQVLDEMLVTARLLTLWRDQLAATVADLDAVTDERARLYTQMLSATLKGMELVARLDLDARRVRVSEQEAALLCGVMDRTMQAMDPSRQQWERGRAVLMAEVQALADAERGVA